MRAFAILFLAVTIIGCSSSIRSTSGSKKHSGSYSAQSLNSKRSFVLKESKKWLGTPYKYGGNGKSGVDCSGFVSLVYAKAGVSLPRRARDMFSVGTPTPIRSIQPGDLVFFKNTAGKGITHVGIYTGQSKFIHASSSSGVVTSSLNQNYYSKHYAGARKILP